MNENSFIEFLMTKNSPRISDLINNLKFHFQTNVFLQEKKKTKTTATTTIWLNAANSGKQLLISEFCRIISYRKIMLYEFKEHQAQNILTCFYL